MVGILIFVDMDIVELPLIKLQSIFVFLEQANRVHDQVIKVHALIVAEFFLIAYIAATNDLFEQAAFKGIIGFWRLQFILCVGDRTQNSTRIIFFGINIQFFQNTFHQSILFRGIHNGETFGIADSVDIPAQNADTH